MVSSTLGKLHERLDARVPVLGFERLGERVALELGVGRLLLPARGLDHVERIGRGHEHVGQEIVGIERDRRQELIELLLAELSVVLRHCRGQRQR